MENVLCGKIGCLYLLTENIRELKCMCFRTYLLRIRKSCVSIEFYSKSSSVLSQMPFFDWLCYSLSRASSLSPSSNKNMIFKNQLTCFLRTVFRETYIESSIAGRAKSKLLKEKLVPKTQNGSEVFLKE